MGETICIPVLFRCFVLFYLGHFGLMYFGNAQSIRFCQVCDGSSGFTGTTIAVYQGYTSIRCTLKCHRDPDCQLASYSEKKKVCKLLTDVTQDCSVRTKDIQLMNEDDIIPIVYPTNASASNETMTNESTTLSTEGTSLTATQMISSPLPALTTISSGATTTAQVTTISSTSTTNGSFIASSVHPWVEALSYNSSQNGAKDSRLPDLINWIRAGADVNLIIRNDTTVTLLPVEWLKLDQISPNMCVTNFGFYLYGSFKPKKSATSGCVSGNIMTEYAWPRSVAHEITVTDTMFDYASFYSRDYSGHYTYQQGHLTPDEIDTIINYTRSGYDIRIRLYDEMLFPDILYYRTDIVQMYALVRKYVSWDTASGALNFAHILHAINGNAAYIHESKSGNFLTLYLENGELDGDMLLQGNWQEVYSVTAKETTGNFTTLRSYVQSGHRVKIVTSEFSAIVDTVVDLPSQSKILVIVAEEFSRTGDAFENPPCRLWTVVDTTGLQRVVKFDQDDNFLSEVADNIAVTWFVDTYDWYVYHISQAGGGDTLSLEQAVGRGVRIRLQYRNPDVAGGARVFLDTSRVENSGTAVTAYTTRSLYIDYTSETVYGNNSAIMYWKMSTDGNSVRYLKKVSTGSYSRLTAMTTYEVTWYGDESLYR